MCGISGYYASNTTDGAAKRAKIARVMNDALSRRGPDHGEIWQDPDVALALGHRRLSIIDLSESGHQPMISASGRYVLTYNGEIYNFPALRQELETSGVAFKGRSDTEIFLSAVEQWGLNRALQKINGMFAFVLWDKKSRELHFVRDRMGKKPLYVGCAGNSLIFGSELKALTKHPDFRGEVNEEILPHYFQTGSIPAPHSIYKKIFQLKPGHRLSLCVADIKHGIDIVSQMKPYWSALEASVASQQKRCITDEGEALSELEAQLSEAVKKRMISDVPLGTFLSGGIDSTLITALAQQQSSASIQSFTIGFDDEAFNEAQFAKEVAQHLGTDHHELYVSPKRALDIIPDLPKIYDEPFADISALPTLILSQFARKKVTVALSGDGGDELFGGYTRHIQADKLWTLSRVLPNFTLPVFEKYIAQKVPKKYLPKVVQALRSKDFASFYDALSMNGMDMHFRNDVVNIDGFTASQKIMLNDAIAYLPSTILTKVDRASMAHSLEVRAPLLDYQLFEFAWQIDHSLKIRERKGKYLLRKMLHKYIPEHLFERPKQGFEIPLSAWLRSDLKEWAQQLFDSSSLDAIKCLNSKNIRDMWAQHKSGIADYGLALWPVLMYLAWEQERAK